jgi:SAM-dependent methyltransferase
VFSKKRLLLNALSFVPGVMALPAVKRKIVRRHSGTSGTDRARYCYTVWLRHLVSAHLNGLDHDPQAVAELGPGDSIGIGLAAILTGAERYYAFDVQRYANLERNLTVFEELLALFQARADIPGPEEWPRVGPELGDYSFPAFLTPQRMARNLRPERLERVRAALRAGGAHDSTNDGSRSDESMIRYRAPWNTRGAIERDSIDLVFSQAVLEHVDDLADVYEAMRQWLKPDGYMSHQIDFKCHDSARAWNGHWTYSNLMWKLARGKDVWLINREPHSTHLKLLDANGFRVVEDKTVQRPSTLTRRQLAPQFRQIPEADLTICDAFIQAVKGPAAASRAAPAA